MYEVRLPCHVTRQSGSQSRNTRSERQTEKNNRIVSDGSALVARKFNSTISQAEKDGKFNSLSFTFDLTGSPEVLDHTGDVYFVYSAAKTSTDIGNYSESSENGLVFIIRIHSYLTGRCSMVSVVPVNGRPDQTYINTWKQIYGGYTN